MPAFWHPALYGATEYRPKSDITVASSSAGSTGFVTCA
jgi:hypothetical protein